MSLLERIIKDIFTLSKLLIHGILCVLLNFLKVKDNEEVRLLEGRGIQTRSRQSAFVEKLKHMPVVEGWATYMHQEAMLAGLALALLYFTVLRCISCGVPELKSFLCRFDSFESVLPTPHLYMLFKNA